MISNKSNQYLNIYKKVLFLFLIFSNLYTFTNIEVRNFIKPLYYLFFIMTIIIFVFSFLFIRFGSQHYVILLVLLFSLLYGIYFGSSVIIFMCLYCLLLNILSVEEIIKETGISYLVTLIICTILSLIGFLPLNYDNGKSGFITYSGLLLGFSSKNTTGFFILFIILSIAVLYKKKHSFFIIVLTMFSVVLESIAIKDRTAAILLLVFLIFYIKDKKENYSELRKYILMFIPIFLTFISYLLAKNWGYSNLVNKINDWLSGRIYIWNLEWNLYHLKLIPQIIGVGNYYDSTTKIPLDGFFALGLLQNGIIFFAFLILILIFSINKVYKKQNYNFLLCYIILVICGFTEMIPMTSSCWLLPVSFVILSEEKSVNI